MTEQEKQIRFDFVSDLIALAKDYGWTLDEAMDIIGFESKQQ